MYFAYSYFAWMFDLHCSEWCMCRVWQSKVVFTFIRCCGDQRLFKMGLNLKAFARSYIQKQTYISPCTSFSNLNVSDMFFSACSFPTMPLFTVLQYFVWPDWRGRSRQVHVASRNTTVCFRAFPINTMEKLCMPCVATIIAIVNAWPPRSATCSLSRSEVHLPVHCRFICCLLTSMAELEISQA